MRVVRSIVGVLLALIGLVVAVVGGGAAFWLIGPDDTVHSGDQHLGSKGLAIASTPDLLNRHGPVLHVDVHSTKNQPVFVGVARDFDVSSYLKGIAHTKLVQVQYPIALSTQDEKGTSGPLAAPDSLDWWVAKANGAGTQSIAWPIEDGPYDVVVMNADGKTAPDVRVNLGIEIPNAFRDALGIFVAGLILLALGILLVLLRRRTPKSKPSASPTHDQQFPHVAPPGSPTQSAHPHASPQSTQPQSQPHAPQPQSPQPQSQSPLAPQPHVPQPHGSSPQGPQQQPGVPPQAPRPQYPPNQYPPTQQPPNQQPPAQRPPAQQPPAQRPLVQGAPAARPPVPAGPSQHPHGPPAQNPTAQGQQHAPGQPPAQGQPPVQGQSPAQAQPPAHGQQPVQGRPPTQGRPPAQSPVKGQPPMQGPPVQGGMAQRLSSLGGVVRGVLALGLTLGLVTGCSAVPAVDTVAAVTRPAIGHDAAVQVIAHYNAVNNKANRTRDDKLIATVEGGNLVRESQAGYTIDRFEKAKPTEPFTYTNPVIGAPQVSSYPMSFVSASSISDSKDYRHLGVWERASAGSPWMLNFAADVKTTVKLPDLAGLRAVSNTDTTRLAAAPQAAATSLAKYMTAGAKAPQAASFTPNADVSELLVSIARDKAALAKDKSVRGASNTFTASKTSPAFMTKSGTAIVFVSLTDEYALLVGKNYEYWWSAAPKTAFSPATVKYQSALTTTTLHDVVLLIPPKGKIQIASFDSQLIDAGGY